MNSVHSVWYDVETESVATRYGAVAYRPTGLDVSADSSVMSYTNTYLNQSSCVNITVIGWGSLASRTIPACNAVKSIILYNDDVKATLAVLDTDVIGYRQLRIIDVYSNDTKVLRQVIATYYAYDVIHVVDGGADYVIVGNSYDSSTSALSISYTVPVAAYR